MEPNLRRIPSQGDVDAEGVITLARDGVTADLLGCLVERDFDALGRYGTRQATRALRQRSAGLLRDALLALAIAGIGRPADPRDLMVGLALHYFVAQQLGQVPAELFDAVAAGLPAGEVRDLLRVFGARQDVTLKAFGWLMVQAADGPDFVPAP